MESEVSLAIEDLKKSGYTEDVLKWRFLFGTLVSVQLEHGLWSLGHFGGRLLGALTMESVLDDDGDPIGFSYIVHNCTMGLSPVPDRIRLVVYSDDPKEPAITHDVLPSSILYVNGLLPPKEERKEEPRVALVQK